MESPTTRPAEDDARSRCLVVDDDEAMRFLLTHHLEGDGAVVVQAVSGDEAVTLIEAQHPPFALVVTDNRMPGDASGPAVLEAAANKDRMTCLLMLTAHVDPTLAARVHLFGAETLDKAHLATVSSRWHRQAARRAR